MNLFENLNAVSTMTLLSTTYPEGVSCFDVSALNITVDQNSGANGVPTFNPKILGVNDTSAYFLLDFTSPYTVVWTNDCVTTAIGVYTAGSCENNPTRTSNGFYPTNSSLVKAEESFTDINIGGYTVSGTVYLS